MTAFDWPTFLREWSAAILASPDVAYYGLPPEAIAQKWLGFEGATEAQIAAAEGRLGMALPPSYRAFLKASNGWRHTGTFIERMLPVEEIYWLRDASDTSLIEHANLYISQLERIPFDPAHDEVNYGHFMDTLVIAEPTREQELFLLNPQVKTAAGEWQAWAFAHWIPGAEAYESFQALLESERDMVVEDNELEAQRITPQDDAQSIVGKVAALIRQLEDDFNFYQPAEEETRTTHPAYQINRSLAEGIHEVLERVRALHSDTSDPGRLRSGLEALVQEYQAKHSESLPGAQSVVDLQEALAQISGPDDPRLAALMQRMTQSSFELNKAQGYIHAASRIRFFLK